MSNGDALIELDGLLPVSGCVWPSTAATQWDMVVRTQLVIQPATFDPAQDGANSTLLPVGLLALHPKNQKQKLLFEPHVFREAGFVYSI